MAEGTRKHAPHLRDATSLSSSDFTPATAGEESQTAGGGGGGTTGAMEQRVATLEKSFEKIDGKLDALIKGIAEGRLENERRFGAIEGRLAGIEAKLDTKATGEALAKIGGELGGRLQGFEGRVSNIPTTWQTVAIIVALLFAVIGITQGPKILPNFTSAPIAPPAAKSTP